jgi:hypothetical protein
MSCRDEGDLIQNEDPSPFPTLSILSKKSKKEESFSKERLDDYLFDWSEFCLVFLKIESVFNLYLPQMFKD